MKLSLRILLFTINKHLALAARPRVAEKKGCPSYGEPLPVASDPISIWHTTPTFAGRSCSYCCGFSCDVVLEWCVTLEMIFLARLLIGLLLVLDGPPAAAAATANPDALLWTKLAAPNHSTLEEGKLHFRFATIALLFGGGMADCFRLRLAD